MTRYEPSLLSQIPPIPGLGVVPAHAREYAIKWHDAALCRYGDPPNDHPFSVHLDAVVATLVEFGHTTDVELAAGFLHDVVEDTLNLPKPITVEMLKLEFGPVIAAHVDAVTDIKFRVDGGLWGNRRTRQEMTYYKTRVYAAHYGDSVINVKLADRRVNMLFSIDNASKQLGMYADEHEWFSESLKDDGGDLAMWAEVDRLHIECTRLARALTEVRKAARLEEHLRRTAV